MGDARKLVERNWEECCKEKGQLAEASEEGLSSKGSVVTMMTMMMMTMMICISEILLRTVIQPKCSSNYNISEHEKMCN